MKSLLIALSLITGLGLAANAYDVKQDWGLNQNARNEMTVALIASGLTPENITAQVGVLAQGNTPIKKIIIQAPEQNIDALVADLQLRFPNVSFSVQYLEKVGN